MFCKEIDLCNLFIAWKCFTLGGLGEYLENILGGFFYFVGALLLHLAECFCGVVNPKIYPLCLISISFLYSLFLCNLFCVSIVICWGGYRANMAKTKN